MNTDEFFKPGSASYIRNVSFETLQRLGIGLPETWDVDCFGLHNNRLILVNGRIVGALITKNDFRHAPLRSIDELVAIEILPQFRRRGFAALAIQALASDGKVLVNSPSPLLLRALRKVSSPRQLDDGGIWEVEFRAETARIQPRSHRAPAELPTRARRSRISHRP